VPTRQFTFPKSRRLTRPAEFEDVKKNGQVHRGQLLVLGILSVKDTNLFRAGFVTSRVLGRAAVRNRARRRLREIVRKHQREIASGIWIVTIARASAAAADFQQLEVEWLRLAKRASILSA